MIHCVLLIALPLHKGSKTFNAGTMSPSSARQSPLPHAGEGAGTEEQLTRRVKASRPKEVGRAWGEKGWKKEKGALVVASGGVAQNPASALPRGLRTEEERTGLAPEVSSGCQGPKKGKACAGE